jgi:membrane fusion protein, multidrug efflux system
MRIGASAVRGHAAGRTSRRLGALAAVVLVGCSRGGGEPSGSREEARRPVVEARIDSVRAGSIPELLRSTGTTRALRQENVSSPVDGKVSELHVLEGDRVRKGDVIARVETKESLTAVTGAQLLLARARTPEEKASAEADVERAHRNETVLEIHAPFDGAVGARGLNEGEFVSAGGTLVTLMDLSSLCFVARLPARDLSRVHPGEESSVGFESAPGHRWPCRVESVKPQMDAAAQIVEVRLRFVAPHPDLRADTFGDAEIVVSRHDGVLLVPDAAVLRDDETGSHSIVEAVGDTLAVVRPVQIGLETPDTVEVQSPDLHAGMHVIVEGHYGLPDSTRIRVQRSEPAAPRPVENTAPAPREPGSGHH